jgi:hypothetical protein
VAFPQLLQGSCRGGGRRYRIMGQVRTGPVDVDNFLPERTAQANSVALPYPTFYKPYTFGKMDSLGGAGMSAFQNDPYVFASKVAIRVTVR